jgi:signal transduction histidine kinase/ActR/RegA family two-component response regulator
VSRRIAPSLALYALLGGAVSVAGWAFDLPRLTDWFDTGISIQPNTALCAVFSGLAVLSLAAARTRVSAASGAVVLLIGGLTLLQWLTRQSFGIDALWLFGREWGSFGTMFPGRMGPPASFSWTLLGVALLFSHSTRPLRRIASVMGVLTAAISSLSLLGYLYDIDKLYALPNVTIIALQTSTFIMAVSLGMVSCHRDVEPMRTLLDPGGAGLLARRALPLLIVIPVALGFVRVKGQDAGLYDTGMGTGLLVLLLIGFLTTLMGWSLRALRVRELRERAATQQLVASREAELERRRDMEALVHAAPAAIWVARDRECQFIVGNPAAAALLRSSTQANMSLREDGDESVRQVAVFRNGAQLHPDDLPMRVAATTGHAVPNQDLEFRFPDGSSKWAYGNAMPLLDSERNVRGAIATFVDITPLKHAEALLRDADRRKDEFLATLAHELRNPLAPIRNALTVLHLQDKAGGTPDRLPTAAVGTRQLALAMMTRQVDHMVRLIDDLLDVSRISQGKVPLRLEAVELVGLLEHVVEACRPTSDRAGQRLTLTAPAPALFVQADPIRLAQIFTNLLNNACKFTGDDGRIAVVVERDGHTAVVSVEDNGIGIPPDKLHSVFELFTQVDHTLEKSEGGLGIGLTLVRQLVALHGGSVDARSDGPGTGSTFVVRLPLVDHPVQAAESPWHPATSRATQRILVVDDNRDSADTMAMLLELAGHDACVAYNGEEALAAADAHRPDVILLDIGLPGLSGHDVCRRIREASWGADIMIVALTGWGQDDDRRLSAEAGFDAHLVKPVDQGTLIELMATGRSQARRG